MEARGWRKEEGEKESPISLKWERRGGNGRKQEEGMEERRRGEEEMKEEARRRRRRGWKYLEWLKLLRLNHQKVGSSIELFPAAW